MHFRVLGIAAFLSNQSWPTELSTGLLFDLASFSPWLSVWTRYLCKGLKNPNGVARITLNYEKFLLDKDGIPVRRYPRKLQAADFEQDIRVRKK